MADLTRSAQTADTPVEAAAADSGPPVCDCPKPCACYSCERWLVVRTARGRGAACRFPGNTTPPDERILRNPHVSWTLSLIGDFGKCTAHRLSSVSFEQLTKIAWPAPRRFPFSLEPVKGLARKAQKLADYFTPEEVEALVVAAPSYPTRMAFRIMLRTGPRVSEALSVRRNDLRLNTKPKPR